MPFHACDDCFSPLQVPCAKQATLIIFPCWIQRVRNKKASVFSTRERENCNKVGIGILSFKTHLSHIL